MVMLLPAMAVVVELMMGASMSERYHHHHDTYAISRVVTRTFTLVMIFMGVLGALTGWLCRLGVFKVDALVPLSFFVAFQLTVMVLDMAVARYRVMSYDDRMIVFPAFAPARVIEYDQIDLMRWVPSVLGPHLHDLRVYTKDGTKARLWCLLDIDQMLLRIDRFDVLEG